MATLSEHVAAIKAAVEAARADGFRVVLENGEEYGDAYVDLEEYALKNGRWRPVDWENVIEKFD